MAEHIINLRNQESRTRPVIRPGARSDDRADLNLHTETRIEKRNPASSIKPPQNKKSLLQWTALEYPLQERGAYWFLAPSAVTLAFVLFGILIRSYFFIVFVVLALAVVLLYAKRRPREYRFTMTKEGVSIGGTLHRFSELKSFWIFDTSEKPELSLETAKLLHPYLRLPLGEIHPNKVRSVLSDFLPEQEHKDFFTDQIARSVGF